MFPSDLSTLVTYNPATVTANTRLEDVRRRMQVYAVRHLPVVDADRHVIGVISQRDLRGNGTAQDVMSRSPVTCDVTTLPAAALATMRRNGFHSLPVVQQHRLVGMITTTDFLREFAYGGAPEGREPIARYVVHPEAHVAPDEPLSACRSLMDALHTDHLAVVKGECPVGILSRDTIPAGAPLGEPCEPAVETTAGDGADPRAPVLRTSDTLAAAAARLMDAECAAVVDRANRFVGLLTDGAIIDMMLAAGAIPVGA
jgi:CBS domain-containing protein